MDPNATLEEIRRLVADLRVLIDDQDELGEAGEDGTLALGETWLLEIAEKGDRLIELVQAMDDWLRKGGFLPTAWQR